MEAMEMSCPREGKGLLAVDKRGFVINVVRGCCKAAGLRPAGRPGSMTRPRHSFKRDY